jgi:hypothetical protein
VPVTSPTRRTAIPLLALLVSTVLVAGSTPATIEIALARTRSDPAHEQTWISRENARPGTSAWQIPSGAKHGIVGFASKVSADLGGRVALYVDTTADSFRVRAYRMGYYDGLGGRLIWTSKSVPGDNQPPPTITSDTNTVETGWTPSTSFRIGSGWREGTYLLKLVSNVGGQAYVPLIVRNDASHAALAIQQQVTTWEAYNRWGGASLYHGVDGSFAERSRVVTFDRPYSGRGASALLNSLPFVLLAERRGLDVTYATDIDLHQRPELLLHHRALISLDHDEYWSTAMRDGATDARAAGVNLAFLGANAIYRHIRLEPSSVGRDRHVVSYKVASEDPLFGVDDSEVTVNWREPPLRDPESELLGAMYDCFPVHADMVVPNGDVWVFAGTGLNDHDHLPGAVDMEYDRIFPDAPTPGSIQVLAHSPLSCKGDPRAADMTYYTARSGAGVIDIGSQGWVKLIRCLRPLRTSTCDPRAVRITLNVLRAFAAGPVGDDHPSRPNTADFGYDLSRPTDP